MPRPGLAARRRTADRRRRASWAAAWSTPGMAHPRPRPPDRRRAGRRAVTVVVPVRDRSDALDRCLGSLGAASRRWWWSTTAPDDPDAVAAVCRAARGPADPARGQRRPGRRPQRGHRRPSTPSWWPSWTATARSPRAGSTRLVWLFDDPGIAAVAPRVRPDAPAPAGLDPRHRPIPDARSPLDMGPTPSEVGPDRAVRYVPTAALVVRRSALAGGFDPDLRVGEDVDLVWRCSTPGWRVRYHPSVTVCHHEPGVVARAPGPPVPLRDLGRPTGPSATPAGWPRSSSVRGRRRPSWPGWPADPGPLPTGDGGGRRPSFGRSATTASRRRSPSAGARRPPGGQWSGLGRAATMLAGPALAIGRAPGSAPPPSGGRGAGPGSPAGRVVATAPRARPGPLGGGVHRRRRGLRSRGVGRVPANAVVRPPDAGPSARTG